MIANAKLSAYLVAESATAAAWLAVARRVLAGDYRRADKSTLQSLIIGLRSHPHADAQAAVKMLESPQ